MTRLLWSMLAAFAANASAVALMWSLLYRSGTAVLVAIACLPIVAAGTKYARR